MILFDDKIAGFFIINKGYRNKYDFSNEKGIGLLGYFIDKSIRGKRIGKMHV